MHSKTKLDNCLGRKALININPEICANLCNLWIQSPF